MNQKKNIFSSFQLRPFSLLNSSILDHPDVLYTKENTFLYHVLCSYSMPAFNHISWMSLVSKICTELDATLIPFTKITGNSVSQKNKTLFPRTWIRCTQFCRVLSPGAAIHLPALCSGVWPSPSPWGSPPPQY